MQQLLYNPKAQETLAAFIRGGRFPHAILLDGPPGSGKGTFGRQLAAAILCQEADKPCGQCRHCRKIEKCIHPDLLEYGGGDSARSFHIETVREIRAQSAIRPNDGDAKVFLLSNVHNMSVQAQNALLKLIEEPPRGVHFILTCTGRAQLLPTVLSRVAVIPVVLPQVSQCAEALPLFVPDATAERCAKAAENSRGCIGRAIELLQQQEDSYEAQALGIMADLLSGQELDALEALLPLQRNRKAMEELFAGARALAAKQLSGEGQALPKRVTPLQLIKIIDIIDDVSRGISANINGLLSATVFCSRIRQVMAD